MEILPALADDIRAPGFVTLICQTPDCGWGEWVEPLSPAVELAKKGEFRCEFCTGALIRMPDNTVIRARPSV